MKKIKIQKDFLNIMYQLIKLPFRYTHVHTIMMKNKLRKIKFISDIS